jgi:hopene-associated glycosyltransferase HpnB
MMIFILISVWLSAVIWLYLLGAHGQFWRSDQRFEPQTNGLEVGETIPRVCVLVPARNEADVIARSIGSLLDQDYPGTIDIILIDDQSDDGTGLIAKSLAELHPKGDRLHIIGGRPLAQGWSGKLWALQQGFLAVQSWEAPPDYLLLTDADIAHPPDNLRRLVAKADQDDRALVSVMVQLRCESPWERLLIPAFVFFFEKLYPFRWVNDPDRNIAAAAGGCSLVRRSALVELNGFEAIRGALIDDCSLAAAIKKNQRRIWLGLSTNTHSLRPYPDLETIWTMVARTAYSQLFFSPFLLVGTIVGMGLVYLAGPIGLVYGLIVGAPLLAIVAGSVWVGMAIAYGPTLRLYRQPRWYGLLLPLIGLLYAAMTIDSARQYYLGRGGAWKGRVYQ